jgi:hypothetical protein
LCLFGYSQDTVRIKNLNFYQANKINILVSPTGKQTVIKILDKALGWTEEDTELINDPDIGRFASVKRNTKSYVDPTMSIEQKQRIKENECINTRFAGLSRSKVKTTLAQGSSNTYTSLKKFLITLPPDEDMGPVVGALKKPWLQRSIQEDKKVILKNVFLYAYAREKDNDYHLILTNADRTLFFNAEISGLPANSATSYQALKAVRRVFDTYPGALRCGSYSFPETPLKIAILKGSLFFDTDHSAGRVGPQGARPETAWEIHPVTDIRFE